MEWGESDCEPVAKHIQTVDPEAYDARETSDPATRFPIRSCDGVDAANNQNFGVTGGGG